MDKQQVIERLNNKLSETLKFQQIFEPLSEGHSGCESRANAYMTAINYVEQLDEPQKVKVPVFVAKWIELCKEKADASSCLNGYYEIGNGTIVRPRGFSDEFYDWLADCGHMDDLARAWLDGYEVEEAKWAVKEGDLVIRKGCHEAKVYFVESVDDDGILLVNGIKDEFFTDGPERAVDEETLSYFYGNFRLLAKKENLEVEKVEE